MKKIRILPFLLVSIVLLSACDKDDDNQTSAPLSDPDKSGLLFMLEEEKMARDVYIYLFDTWGLTQFENINESEASHVNAVASTLDKFNVPYTILVEGTYNNSELQDLYFTLIEQGEVSAVEALKVGATIEDLDIVDLQQFMDATSNPKILKLYERLQCGSRNHLRSFVNGLENAGSSYQPQYLSEDAYNQIISGQNESCS